MNLALGLEPARVGRIVQLSAPNLGSPMATRMQPLKWWFGPAMDDLQIRVADRTTQYEIGAIAGTIAPDFCRHVTGIIGPNDGTVSVRSAFAAAQKNNRITFPVQHTLMLIHPGVIGAVSDFIGVGRFND